jgi:hypothetical protein
LFVLLNQYGIWAVHYVIYCITCLKRQYVHKYIVGTFFNKWKFLFLKRTELELYNPDSIAAILYTEYNNCAEEAELHAFVYLHFVQIHDLILGCTLTIKYLSQLLWTACTPTVTCTLYMTVHTLLKQSYGKFLSKLWNLSSSGLYYFYPLVLHIIRFNKYTVESLLSSSMHYSIKVLITEYFALKII